VGGRRCAPAACRLVALPAVHSSAPCLERETPPHSILSLPRQPSLCHGVAVPSRPTYACTRPIEANHPHQNKRKMIRYCESFGYSGKDTLNTITNNLTQVSVPTEDDHNNHQPSHMTLRDQHFCAHFMPYKLLRNNKITLPITKAYTTLIVLLKPQIIK
jgi:hypothetical protein